MRTGSSLPASSARIDSSRTKLERVDDCDHSTMTTRASVELLLDDFGELRPAGKLAVPPDFDAESGESLCDVFRSVAVVARVADEDLGQRFDPEPLRVVTHNGLRRPHRAIPPRRERRLERHAP